MSWRDRTDCKRMEVFIPPESMDKLDIMCKEHQRSRAQIITMLIDTGLIPELDTKGKEVISLLMEIKDKIDQFQSAKKTDPEINDNVTTGEQHKNSTVSIPVSIDNTQQSHDDIMRLANNLYDKLGSWNEVASELNKSNPLNDKKRWVANSIKSAVSKWKKV